jgi:hypothetical protein
MISTDQPSSANQIVRYGFPSILMSPSPTHRPSATDQSTVAGQQHYPDITPAIDQIADLLGDAPITLSGPGAPDIVASLQSEFDHLRTTDPGVKIVSHLFPSIAGTVGAGGKKPHQDTIQLLFVCGTEPIRTVDLQFLGMIRNPHHLHSVVPRSINKVEIMGNNGTVPDLFP